MMTNDNHGDYCQFCAAGSPALPYEKNGVRYWMHRTEGDEDLACRASALRLAEWALENCRLLAARMTTRRHKTFDPEWEHILRFCEMAGVYGSVLR